MDVDQLCFVALDEVPEGFSVVFALWIGVLGLSGCGDGERASGGISFEFGSTKSSTSSHEFIKVFDFEPAKDVRNGENGSLSSCSITIWSVCCSWVEDVESRLARFTPPAPVFFWFDGV